MVRFLIYVWLILLYVGQTEAQILNISKLGSTLNLSETFLDSLENCQEFDGYKSAFANGSEAKLIYQITPQDQKCHLVVIAETEHYIHITQDCLFPLKTAAEYAQSLRRFNNKRYSIIKQTFELNRDEDYIAASRIMQNSDLCRFTRAEIDNTKLIRENLPLCRPVTSEEKLETGKITRRIEGRDLETDCRYHYTLWVPAPDTSHIKADSEEIRAQLQKITDSEYHYVCAFDDKLRDEYILLLESLVLPEEYGADFTSVARFSSRIELEFIGEHCEYVSDKDKKK